MDPDLRDLLRTVSTESVNNGHSHISMYGPHGKWQITPQYHTPFWSGYCRLLYEKSESSFNCPAANVDLCLAERPQDIMPVISHISFKFNSDDNDDDWEPFNDEFIRNVVYIYQQVISEYFQLLSDSGFEMIAVILESQSHWIEQDNSSEQNLLCIDIRLQFPYCKIDTGLQNRLIRTKVIQLLRKHNIMSLLDRQPVGDWEGIIQTDIVNNPVIMYGSNGIQGRPKLWKRHIWNLITPDMIENSILPEELELSDVFSPTSHNFVKQNSIDSNIFQSENDTLEYWMPLFLSINYWSKVVLPITNQTDTFSNQMIIRDQNYKNKVFGNGDFTETVYDISEIAEQMIAMLSPIRFTNETNWLDIGKALYSANSGSENGLLSWIRHSIKAVNDNGPPYMTVGGSIAETCRNNYYMFDSSMITVKTLAWYAKEDNPAKYSNWHHDWCMTSMESALSCTHTDVAMALHRVYWLTYVYCPIGTGKWFQFINHRWKEMHQGITLRAALSNNFRKRFEAVRAELAKQVNDSTDERFKDRAELTMKKIAALISKLKSVAFKSCIMTEAKEHFVEPQFMDYLDSNYNITGMLNGVIEVVDRNIYFRAAKPEDFISMSTRVPFHNDYHWQHPLVKTCYKWLNQAFPDRELLHHFLKFSASCYKGKNSDKIFPILTGEGDNSKSMIVKLFEASFGSYCMKFDVANFTCKNSNASGPTPQLARAKGARIAFIDEPDDDVPMHKGTLKRWVGGDSFFARLLQDNGGDVVVSFKLALICNKIPTIINPDKAIKSRTKVFPFLSCWVKDNVSEDEEEQMRQRRFKMDPFFETKIPILAPAFLWILTQYYPHYVTEGLRDPLIIQEHTEKYWRDGDIYSQFISESIVDAIKPNGDRDATAKVTLTEIYTHFKEWFRESFPGSKIPDRPLVKDQLSLRWGHMRGNGWHGIRLITETNEAEPVTIAPMIRRTTPVRIVKTKEPTPPRSTFTPLIEG